MSMTDDDFKVVRACIAEAHLQPHPTKNAAALLSHCTALLAALGEARARLAASHQREQASDERVCVLDRCLDEARDGVTKAEADRDTVRSLAGVILSIGVIELDSYSAPEVARMILHESQEAEAEVAALLSHCTGLLSALDEARSAHGETIAESAGLMRAAEWRAEKAEADASDWHTCSEEWKAIAEKAEAERDLLRAVVGRVRSHIDDEDACLACGHVEVSLRGHQDNCPMFALDAATRDEADDGEV